MSKVFNMVGGGGGKNISSIIITGLESTDTVTCTKDGNTYPATWDETAQHWEIVGLPLGMFTITATNGTKTTTETVLIDITGVYEIEMSYIRFLYKDGDKCEKLTGGWSSNKAGNATFTEENNCLVAYGGSNSGAYGKFYTVNLIDVSNFEKLKITIQNCTVSNDSSFFGLSANTNIHANFNENVEIAYKYMQNAGTYEIDISNIGGSYYVCFGSGNLGRKAYATKIWLE